MQRFRLHVVMCGHVTSHVSSRLQEDRMDHGSSYHCSTCSYKTSSKLDLIKHSFASHSMEPTFKFLCGIDGCLQSFKYGSTFSSFKTHASRKHCNWQNHLSVPLDATSTSSISAQPIYEKPPVVSELTPPNEELMDLGDISLSHETSGSSSANKLFPVETAALFLLSFKERFKLPQRALDYAIGSINSIAEDVCVGVRESIKARFQEKGSSFDITDIEQCCVYSDIFKDLRTEHLQSKFYKDHFGLVVS